MLETSRESRRAERRFRHDSKEDVTKAFGGQKDGVDGELPWRGARREPSFRGSMRGGRGDRHRLRVPQARVRLNAREITAAFNRDGSLAPGGFSLLMPG